MSWEALVDTSQPSGLVASGERYTPGEVYRLQAHSFALFINRAPRPEAPPRNSFISGVVRPENAVSGEDDATAS
jgi:hypothetical protein